MYIPIIRISFLLSSNAKFRYDVEYDENRIAIAVDIGRRFLAIDTPTALNNGICDISDVIRSANENAVDDDDANNTSSTIENNTAAETENHNNTTTNSSSNNHKNYEQHNGDEHNNGSNQQQKHTLSDGSATHDAGGSGGGDSGVDAGDTVGGGSGEGSGGGGGGDDTGGGDLNKDSSNCHYSPGVGKLNPATGDELVLDVLNDDLIARVRDKITSGNKELFEPCVTAVKAFLAGEPFQEFETSMYFHR